MLRSSSSIMALSNLEALIVSERGQLFDQGVVCEEDSRIGGQWRLSERMRKSDLYSKGCRTAGETSSALGGIRNGHLHSGCCVALFSEECSANQIHQELNSDPGLERLEEVSWACKRTRPRGSASGGMGPK